MRGSAGMEVQWSSFQRLTEENVNKYVPKSAGVYLLWVQLKSEKWRCDYVGQADDLERRLLEHMSDSEENDCIKEHVKEHILNYMYATVPRQSDRDGVEKFLYDHYGPKCNVVDPGGDPIEVNLP
jgi:excinuclease UvrABC nuclease subunit